jgi:hypothetical protein
LMLLTVILALPSLARAAGKDTGERVAHAQAACLSGDYAKGVAILAGLYVSTRDPIYIFNQGRCFEQNGKYEEAIVRFREFQRKNANAGRPSDPMAEQHIADCQSLLDKQKPAAPAVPAPPPPASEPVTVAAPVAPVSPPIVQAESKPESVEVPSAVVSTAPAAEPAGDGFGLRIAGIATAVAGMGAIATAVVLNLKANDLSKDLEAANNSQETLYSRSKASTRSRYETWGWVAYGTGAACVAGGAVLYLLGHHQARPQVAIVPALADGHVGAALQGAF